jgi:hypothetical protein
MCNERNMSNIIFILLCISFICTRPAFCWLVFLFSTEEEGVRIVAVTRCWLDGPVLNPGRGELFRTHPDWPEAHPLPHMKVTAFFLPGLMRLELNSDHPPLYTASLLCLSEMQWDRFVLPLSHCVINQTNTRAGEFAAPARRTLSLTWL